MTQNNQNNQMTKSVTKQTMSEWAILTFVASFIVLTIGLFLSHTERLDDVDELHTEEYPNVMRILPEEEVNDASIIKVNVPKNININFDIDLEFVDQSEITLNQQYKQSLSIDDVDIIIKDNLITIDFDAIDDSSYDTDASHYVDLDIVLPRKDWSIYLPQERYGENSYVVNEGEAINLNIVVNSLRVTGNFGHLNIMDPYGVFQNYTGQKIMGLGNVNIDKLKLFSNDINLGVDTEEGLVNIKDIHLYNDPQSNLELNLYDNSGLLGNTHWHTLTQEQTTKLENKDMSLFETD